jgi:hypothetical protein
MTNANAEMPSPAAAAAALAELRARREQVLRAHAAPTPAWELPLTMALTFAEWATRDLKGTDRHRPARTAVRAAEAAATLVRPGQGSLRVPPDPAWLAHALPPRDAPVEDDDDDDRHAPVEQDDAWALGAASGSGCGRAVLLMAVAATVPQLLARRLAHHDVRWPNTITGAVTALAIPPAARLAQALVSDAIDRERFFPDIAARGSFPPEWAPEPAFEPRFGDPDLLPLLGLLAPAGDVSDGFLRQAAGLDRAELEQRSAPLVAAGLVARRRSGWLRPERTTGLTPQGRAALAAHAAALRAAGDGTA